jgi:hypothetical protein
MIRCLDTANGVNVIAANQKALGVGAILAMSL